MRYRTEPEKTRLVMAAGVVLAVSIGLAAGLAAPLPERVTDPRYELALIDAAGDSHIVDYGLTLADCVNRWPDFPGFILACDRDWSR